MDWTHERLLVLALTVVAILLGYFFRGFLQELGKDCFFFLKRRFASAPSSSTSERADGAALQVAVGNQLQVPEPTPHIPDLTLEQIEAEIEKSAPLMREQVARRYIGIRVEWNLYLRAASEKGEKFYVRLSIRPNWVAGVVCYVDAATYPQLRLLYEGHPLRVSGVIKSCMFGDIELEDVRLTVLPNKKP